MTGKIEVRWATEADIRAVYGDESFETMRAKVALIDGEPVGLAGYYLRGGVAFVFSTQLGPLEGKGRFILREARKFMSEIKFPARCVADPARPSAGRFLRRLGWRLATSVDGLEVYEWQTP